MGKLEWYKRYPERALGGMKKLTLEERGVYNTVLDLIYMHDDDLDDDDRYICGWCNCDLRVYKRIKAQLIAAKKLFTDNGRLRNARASRGVDEALARGVSATYAANEKWRKSNGQSSDSNGLADAPAMRMHMPHTDKKKEEEEEARQIVKTDPLTINLPWLIQHSGSNEATCRKFIGGLMKQHGEDAVLAALRAAKARRTAPANPFGWMTTHITRNSTNGQRTGAGDPVVQRSSAPADLAGIAAAIAGRSLRTRK